MKVVATDAPQQQTPAPNPVAFVNTARTPWQRITLAFLGIAVCLFEWRWATSHLYSLPPTAIASFTTITVNNLYVVGALVVFFVTGRLVYEWKANTANQLVSTVTDSYAVTPSIPPPKAFDNLKEIR